MQARKGVPYGGIGTSLLSAPCLWCGPSPSPSRPPSGTTTGRDLLSDPWRRENGEGAVANEKKEGRNSLGVRGGGAGRVRLVERGGQEGGGNRELTLLIHLLVAFPVYILLPAGYDGL